MVCSYVSVSNEGCRFGAWFCAAFEYSLFQ